MTLAKGDRLAKLAKTYDPETQKYAVIEPRVLANEGYADWEITDLSPTWAEYDETKKTSEVVQFVKLRKVS